MANFERTPMPNLILENAPILYTNFMGEERQYNEAGRRNFNVVLLPETAKKLREDGWTVQKPHKVTAQVREVLERTDTDPSQYIEEIDGEEFIHHMLVKIEFKPKNSYFKPPVVVLCKGNGENEVRRKITEETADRLEEITIKYAHVIIHPSEWDAHKYTPYCDTLYVYALGNPIQDKFGYPTDDYQDSAEEVPF